MSRFWWEGFLVSSWIASQGAYRIVTQRNSILIYVQKLGQTDLNCAALNDHRLR